jgi:hypothetical protein
MNRVVRLVSVLLIALAAPSAASAQLRRAEIKTLGMD